MPEKSIGSFSQRASFTSPYARSSGTLVNAREDVDGNRPMKITHLYGAVSGNGGTRTVKMFLGDSEVSLSRPSSGSAQDTGWINSSDWTTVGGTAFSYGYEDSSGSIFFARGANGTGHTDGPVSDWTGSIGMRYRYIESPSAPTITSVVSNEDGDQSTVTFSAPDDDGGSAITRYWVQRSASPFFLFSYATIESSGGPVIFTDLQPGSTYFYRAIAANVLNDETGLGGPPSTVVSFAQPDVDGFGRVFSGSMFVAADLKVRNPGNSAWVDAEVRRYNGSSWEPVGF
jgi:hypothetical protein